MTTWLIGRPRWLQAAVLGGMFGLLFGVFFGVVKQSWGAGIVAGALGGAMWGPFMTWTMGPIHGRQADAAELVDPEDRLAAVLAASRGPRPNDRPAVVAGALRVARYRHYAQRRTLVVMIVIGAALVALGVVLSLSEGATDLAFSAAGLLLVATVSITFIRTRRQVSQLQELVDRSERSTSEG